MTLDEAHVLAANRAFFTAFSKRDPAAMASLWCQRAPVACVHPGWQALHGRDDVLASWEAILSHPESPKVDCSNEAQNGAHMEITIAKHVAKRQLPLGEYEAQTLVDEFVAEHLLPAEPALRAMVAHVFVRFSRLFSENAALSRLLCKELFIHHSDYRVEHVQIWVDSPLHVKPRLTPHAHDRKAMFGTRSGSEGP